MLLGDHSTDGKPALGLARTGSYGGNGSGDFTIAFTTGDKDVEGLMEAWPSGRRPRGDGFLNPVYRATVEATEEAIVNALFMAETMTGRDGHVRHALPLEQLPEVFESYGRPVG